MDPISTFLVGLVAAAILWVTPKLLEKKQAKKQTETEPESNIHYED
jgi:hypothetical protein